MSAETISSLLYLSSVNPRDRFRGASCERGAKKSINTGRRRFCRPHASLLNKVNGVTTKYVDTAETC